MRSLIYYWNDHMNRAQTGFGARGLNSGEHSRSELVAFQKALRGPAKRTGGRR